MYSSAHSSPMPPTVAAPTDTKPFVVVDDDVGGDVVVVVAADDDAEVGE